MEARAKVQAKAGISADTGTRRSPAAEDSGLELLVLPGRESLEQQAKCPAITEKEASVLLATNMVLERRLAEIDLRLTEKLEGKEGLEKLKTRLSLKEDKLGGALNKYFERGFVVGAALGFLSTSIFALNSSHFLAFPGIVAGTIVSGVAGLFTSGFIGAIVKDPLGEMGLVKRILDDKGSPPLAALPKIPLNTKARLKLSRYKGPLSETAREFDREVEQIEKSALSAFLKCERSRMAREGLLVAREQVQGQLCSIRTKLGNWEIKQKESQEAIKLEETRKKSFEEASGMLKSLIEKLEIPPQADRFYLSEISEKSLEMLKGLKEFKRDRRYSIPERLPALRYFASIISWLDKGEVQEHVKEAFFEKLETVLSARLFSANRSLGRATPGVDD